MFFKTIQRQILFPRHMLQVIPGAGYDVPGLEKIWIKSTQGPVEAWFLPGDGVSANKPGPVAIFAHGNGELIDDWPVEMGGYRRMGVSLLLPEYRGYGRSAGEPSQEAIAEDFLNFHDIAAARPDVDASRIVLHGRSLGGGAVCDLAGKRKPSALVLQSTFTSVRDIAKSFMMPGPLVADPFDNNAVVQSLDVPILIIHGLSDELIPFRHAEANFKSARNARLIPYDCGHNDCPPDWVVFWKDLRDFLATNDVI